MRLAIIRGNTALNPLYDALAAEVRSIVESHAVSAGGKKIILPGHQGRIMKEIDVALNRIFPVRPGVASVLDVAIAGQCARTEQDQATASWTELAAAAPDVARVVEELHG